MKADKTVDYHIKSGWHAISRMYNSFAAPFDMTMAIGYVLLNIDKKGTPATKIAPALGLEPRSLTRMLKSLEDKQWIRRETDEDDRRVVKVYLTEEGKRKRDKAREGVLIFNNAIYEKIGAEKLEIFFEVMEKISEVVDIDTAGYKADNIGEDEFI
ncbi:MarR family winged helix-turn-helix transcriptional regulator [Arcicella rosea]|uniref:DNA-binding MarR family transcriptional regulator n=1 Tax=Arcicella rosea TaxID=502909 RepID=A0A841ERE9_9BACT|nr:MarR family transcriptional regulator [Arcicella rosea]MBB6002011.1 DNA-binding MarR family transcriptional regulator [Arcicella rosea]